MNKCERSAVRILCFNVALVILFIGYFSILRLYAIFNDDVLSSTFANSLFYFSIKLFIYTLSFFTIFVMFMVLIESLVYRMPRILVWSSLILPQVIIMSSQIQFPSNDEIPLTDSQVNRILNTLSNLERYIPNFNRLICSHYNDKHDDDAIIVEHSLQIVIFSQNGTLLNCNNQTSTIRLKTMEYEGIEPEYGLLSFSWTKLLCFILMFIGYNYIFECKYLYSSLLTVISVLFIIWTFGQSSVKDAAIKTNYKYCKLVSFFKDKEMEPIDRYLKLRSIFGESEMSDNFESEEVLKYLEKYIRSGPFYVPQNRFYHKPFSLNLNEWCLKGDTQQCTNTLIEGIKTMEINEGINNRKRMYNAGAEIYKVLLMIVALLWSYLCDIWINIARIVYTEWRKRLILFDYMPVDDVCDLIMQYQTVQVV